jgi:hypothetical protein
MIRRAQASGELVWVGDQVHQDELDRTGEPRSNSTAFSLPYVPGTRHLDRPVYELTSSHTFSGGEDCRCTLQPFGRAELIGETTGGGAHPDDRVLNAMGLIHVDETHTTIPASGHTQRRR